MARNGAGVYSLPAPPSPFVDGQTASATDMMTVLSDLGTAMTGSLAADGQTPISGTMDFNGNNAYDIGATTTKTLATTAGATIGTTLAVTGATTLTGAVSMVDKLTVAGALSIMGKTTLADATTISAGGFAATGNSTVTGTLTVSGVATAANGTSGSELLSYAQFPTTTGATGTITYPTGLIRKWGTGSTVNGTGSVLFATAFPTASDNISITISSGAATHTLTPLICGTADTAGFFVWGNAGESLSFYWEAIGR